MEDDYIPRAIVGKATMLHSYITEAQGKCFCRTREHIRPIHLNISVSSTAKQSPKPTTKTPQPSHIPMPNPHFTSVSQHKNLLPKHSLHPLSHIPKPHQPPQPIPSASNSPASVKHLLHHMSTLNSPSPSI